MQQASKYFLVFFLIYIVLLSSCEDANLLELSAEQKTQQQLELETEKLEQQKTVLADLKKQYAEQTQQINTFYPLQIINNTKQIQNLTDALYALRLSEKDITETTNALFYEQTLAIQNLQDQLDPSINNLQRSLAQTQAQVYVWTNNTFPLTEQQRALLNSLETSSDSQRQQLEVLSKQKRDFSANALSQTRLINQLSRQQKAELVESQEVTQEQIYFLRDEIERLQTEQMQQKVYLTNLNQQILRAQTDYDQQLKIIESFSKSMKK